MNEDLRTALERLDMLEDEMNRIKRALTAVQNGVPFTEAWNEEVFLEEKQEQKKSKSYLSRMTERILKVKYCNNASDCERWRSETDIFRRKLFDITLWVSEKMRDTNLINYLVKNIDDAYEVGVKYYERAAKEYPDLLEGLELIPEKCPWTLEEIMELDIDELLEKLDINEDELGN